ncbi:MAG: hypothetical protein CVU89_14935 [Firmicutes bacterium HGW-Firmicutes-14]|nr:MAG: hypothetical protein CVU89_14935 [Firmicutes bacterium HGW-Firmicutes-14]
MSKGRFRKLFPGGNTSEGFVSLYDQIIGPDATRIFVIKGGPGTGKSTFMRSIGETMLERGYDVEFHCCSSDNGSLDGVCIPQIRVALLDGTAPHVVDPKNPGSVDEIVHLGDFWDEDLLRQHKESVLETNRRINRFFQLAYLSLNEARAIREEWSSYITEATDFATINEVTAVIMDEIFSGTIPDFRTPGKTRRLFATAITPDGSMNYLDTVFRNVAKLFVIKGEPGSGKASLLGRIADRTGLLCLDRELYHCSFRPQNIDIVVIPQLATAVANLSAPIDFDPNSLPSLDTLKEINLSSFADRRALAGYSAEITACRVRFEAAFSRAVSFLNRAKKEHDLLESYYVPAMDFQAINTKREAILARIERYADELE